MRLPSYKGSRSNGFAINYETQVTWAQWKASASVTQVPGEIEKWAAGEMDTMKSLSLDLRTVSSEMAKHI